MDLVSALQAVQPSRKSILFLGAGFSNSAQNEFGLPTPSGSQLSERILAYLKIPGSAPLGLAIDKLREKLPLAEGYSFVKKQLSTTALTADQEFILDLPWTRIYTTNVDNIGYIYGKRTCRDSASDVTQDANQGDYICLHGCIENCDQNNYYQKLKLGEQLYVANAMASSRYNQALQKDLFEADCVIVIGYSMADPNYQEMFFSSEALISKCFVVSGVPDELSAHRIELIGFNTNKTLAELVHLFKSSPPASTTKYVRSEIIEDRGSFSRKDVTQTARQNLLIYGRFDENVARTSWVESDQVYAVKRAISIDIASLEGPRIALIHSHLGNGKSIIIDYSRFVITQQGKSVFVVKEEVSGPSLRGVISDIPIGSHVFYEGDIFSVVDTVDAVTDRALVLCVTSRSTTMRVAMPALARATKGRNLLKVFDANDLMASELAEFHDLVDSMAFWPDDLANIGRDKRMRKLSEEYNNNINAIILRIFENVKVKRQVMQQWKKASVALRPVFDHFIVASYMKMIDISVPAYVLNEFQWMDYRGLISVENDIIKIEHSGQIYFGNSIIAIFILNQFDNKEDIIGAIVRFANFIDGHVAQRSYQWVVRRLLRYWNLTRILGSTTQPNEVFDRASYIPSVHTDPLFWVQYSIAQMENNNFIAAERYLSRSYAQAKERKGRFDTYQIDTHFARYVVRKIIAQGMYENAVRDILDSVSKLLAVVERRPDDVYHVASVVQLMLSSKLNLAFMLKTRDYNILKREMLLIKSRIQMQDNGSLFDIERHAVDLIYREFG